MPGVLTSTTSAVLASDVPAVLKPNSPRMACSRVGQKRGAEVVMDSEAEPTWGPRP